MIKTGNTSLRARRAALKEQNRNKAVVHLTKRINAIVSELNSGRLNRTEHTKLTASAQFLSKVRDTTKANLAKYGAPQNISMTDAVPQPIAA